MADFLIDIGKVLLDFDFEPSLANLLPADREDPLKSIAPLLEKKDEFEAGKISAEDYIRWAIEKLEINVSHQEFRTAWQEIFTPNLAMWDTIRELRGDGHRLILFSNTNEIHCPYVFERYPELNLFHGAILSFEEGHIKPEPEIYQAAIRDYELNPSETLYIDDLPGNITAGRDLGFRSFQYDLKDHRAFEQWLKEQLASFS